jgi:stage V sporulation protein B
MKKSQKLVLNTLLLTATALLMQTISVAFNVYLTNKIGAAGIGLFQLTLTVYGLAATFACAGVRLGTTRLHIDLLSANASAGMRRCMRLCLFYALTLGVTMAALLYLGAPLAATYWLKEPAAAESLRRLALGLPLVSLSSAMHGYFTATRTVYKSALAQGAEQLVKIVTVVTLLRLWLSGGIQNASLAIVTGLVAGNLASFLFSLLLVYTSKPMRRGAAQATPTLRDFLHIAAPDGAGAGARSVLLTAEHLLIPWGFRQSGRSNAETMKIYGVIHGMALPVLLYPSAILSSLSGLLVPELADLRVRGRNETIGAAVRKVTHLSLLYGVFVGGMFFTFAEALSLRIYGNADAAPYLQLLAPLVPIMYLDMSVDGMLKGLDEQRASMFYNILDSALCCLLVYLLLPRIAVKGYIIVLFVSELFNFYLSLRRLLTVTHVPRPALAEIGKPLLGAACAGLIPRALLTFWSAPSAPPRTTPALLFGLICGAGIYFVFLCLSGSLTPLRGTPQK